jgi:hypothetical protein
MTSRTISYFDLSCIFFSNLNANKRISLWNSSSTADEADNKTATEFYGFGTNSDTLRYQVPVNKSHQFCISSTVVMGLNSAGLDTLCSGTADSYNMGLRVRNTSNTANQNASMLVSVAGTSAGKAYYSADVAGIGGWSHGVRSSDHTKYVFNNSFDFTGTDIITLNKTGNGGLTVSSGGLTVSSGGLTVSSGGLTVSNGGLTVSSGGLTVSSGGLTVSNFPIELYRFYNINNGNYSGDFGIYFRINGTDDTGIPYSSFASGHTYVIDMYVNGDTFVTYHIHLDMSLTNGTYYVYLPSNANTNVPNCRVKVVTHWTPAFFYGANRTTAMANFGDPLARDFIKIFELIGHNYGNNRRWTLIEPVYI